MEKPRRIVVEVVPGKQGIKMRHSRVLSDDEDDKTPNPEEQFETASEVRERFDFLFDACLERERERTKTIQAVEAVMNNVALPKSIRDAARSELGKYKLVFPENVSSATE